MKRFLILIIGITLLGISCKKDDTSSQSSSLFVKVVGYNNSSIEGATIVTVPETQTVVSDIFGTATIDNIPLGTYDVYAIYDNYGSGKKSVQIAENSGTDVEINVEYGNFPDFIPQIYVTKPDYQGNSFTFGSPDSVAFELEIKNGTPGNQVIWESDLDGEIGTSAISDDLTSSMSFTNLSDGEHIFSLIAKGDEGIDGYLSFTVKTNGPSTVYLYPLEVVSFKLKLTWSYYTGDNFDQYKIVQRRLHDGGGYSESTIESFQGEWDTTATISIQNDENCEYYIKVQTEDYYSSSSSNVRSFEKGYFGVSFNSYCRDMVLHKYKNHVYLIYSDEVVLYDYENREIIATRSISDIQQHYDIRYDGDNATLYFASDFRVYILNGEDLTLNKAVNLPNNVYSVAAISNDVFFASVYHNNSDYTIYSYSLSQSKIIDSIGHEDNNTFYLNRVPVSNKIIVFNRYYNYELYYLNYNANGEIVGFDYTSTTGDYDYDDYPFSFPPNGEYFIPIRAASKVYQTNENMSVVGTLSNNFEYRSLTYSPNGDTIFGLPSSNSYWFTTYTYPGLELVDEIETEYYFSFIERKGNDFYCLISISSNYNSNSYFMKYKPQ